MEALGLFSWGEGRCVLNNGSDVRLNVECLLLDLLPHSRNAPVEFLVWCVKPRLVIHNTFSTDFFFGGGVLGIGG
jgi:hypothetical protein